MTVVKWRLPKGAGRRLFQGATHTLTPVQPQPGPHWSTPPARVVGGYLNRFGAQQDDESIRAPFGVPGDRAWVPGSHLRPRGVVRLKAVNALRLSQVTEEQARACGSSCLATLLTEWQLHRPELPLTDDPWVWLLEWAVELRAPRGQ